MQQAYFERIGDLVNDLFDVERLHDRIDRTAEVIRRDLALNDPAEIPDYLEEVSELKERVARRYETLRRELDGPAKVPKFDSNGLVSLKTWNQDQFFGKPKIESVEHEGTRSLMLSTEAGTSVGQHSFLLRCSASTNVSPHARLIQSWACRRTDLDSKFSEKPIHSNQILVL